MARKPRQTEDGVIYHVMSQVNRRRYLIKYSKYKKAILRILKRASDIYKCEIINFCIMNNHIHLLVKPALDNLSRCMQWIFGMIAREYNRLSGGCGRLWRGRFKSEIVKDEEYYRNCFEYIVYNPLRAKIARRIDEYKYSGIYHIINNDYSIIKKPEPEMKAFIDEMIRKAEDPDYLKEKSKPKSEYGFYPGKPGRRKAA